MKRNLPPERGEADRFQIENEVGNWVIDRELGAGGMGTVYRAHHRVLKTPAAVKLLAPALTFDKKIRDRFLVEAQTQAQLRHPHIAQVLDYVEQDGKWFLVIEYLENGSLAEVVERTGGPVPIPQALQWISQALEALDVAHQNAVIHRDVKSSNILLDRFNNAKVTDFGIVMVLGGERLTSTGMSLGTPHYMSPEQIVSPHQVDHRTDVYSIGIVLYELLAGKVPFESDSDFIVREAQVNRQPPRLRELNPDVPQALEEVVMRALAKDRDQRYSGCGEFAGEIRGFLGGDAAFQVRIDTPSARPEPWKAAATPEKRRSILRKKEKAPLAPADARSSTTMASSSRRPLPRWTLAVPVVLVLVGIALAAQPLHEISREKNLAEKADSEVDDRLGPSSPLSSDLEVEVQMGHAGLVLAVAFSGDGRYAFSGGSDGTVKVWNRETGRLIRTLKDHAHGVTALAPFPDGSGPGGPHVLSGSRDGTAIVWNVESGEVVCVCEGDSEVNAVDVSPDGRYLLTGDSSYNARLWSDTCEQFGSPLGHEANVMAVVFSPDGSKILTGSYRGVRLWATEKGRLLKHHREHQDWVRTVTFAPDGQTYYSGDDDDLIKIWATHSNSPTRTLAGENGYIYSLAASSDGYRLFSAHSGKVEIWNLRSSGVVDSFSFHLVRFMDLSPDDEYLLIGGSSLSMRTVSGREVWSSNVGRPRRSVAFNAEGDFLFVAAGKKVDIWALGTIPRSVGSMSGHSDYVYSLAYAGPSRVLSCSWDKTLILWDTVRETQVQKFRGHSKDVNTVAVSPDLRYAASGSDDEVVKLWNLSLGSEIRELTGHSDRVRSVAFSPDGRLVASGSDD